ncbi:hypothetical protein FACS189454_02210 [Planctomycetales bacterium]|nr:hypothetical protein FACS189454_02210 [Planctomycetales bacterium]
MRRTILFAFVFTLFTATVFAATFSVGADSFAEVLVTADSEDAGYEAYRAMDGDVKTMWHTNFHNALNGGGRIDQLPHTLTVDMRKPRTIKGFVLTMRNDGFNGDVGKYEVYVTDIINGTDKPAAASEFSKAANLNEKKSNRIEFAEPQTGRYFVLRAFSDLSGNQYTSVAELELLCDDATFKAKKMTAVDILREKLTEQLGNINPELFDEYVRLAQDIKSKAKFDKVAAETFNKESLILDGDRDPADVVFRRTKALAADLQSPLAARLASLQAEVVGTPAEDTAKRFTLFTKIRELRREIAFSNPLLNFKELLFVKKHRATYNHMCDQYYGINIPAGGGVFVLDFDTKKIAAGLAPTVKNLLTNATVENGRLAGKKLTTGSFLAPDISYDAKKLAFAYVECESEDNSDSRKILPPYYVDTNQRFHTDHSKGHWHEGRCFHIFTSNIDGSNLQQITDGTWNDFDPCWLPNGRMAFITERRGGYLRCGRACPTFTLFDMNPDGSMMRALSFHETNEWHPSVTNDGRILYTRWDYPDRHGCTAHQAWITTLDGRDPRQVHGNFAPREVRHDMELDCRPIPNSPKFVATGAPHHGQSYGSLVLIDPQMKDDDAMAPAKRLTPDVAFPETQGGTQTYGAPYPLSENYYLCVADFSVTAQQGAEWNSKIRGDYGIYLVDVFGNKELIYRDPEIGCNSPLPVIARPTPPVVPQMISENIEHQPYLLPEREKLAQREQGTVMINNVYETIRPYPAGTKLKELRVIQLIPMSTPSGGRVHHQPHETGFREPTSGDSVVLCRNVWGTVPIEEDGSVHFKVPPRREFQLQVIDEDGLAVQSMRSSIYLHDGETLSCTGCHEQQAAAVKSVSGSAVPKALVKPAATIKPSFDDAVNFSYPRLIQPIWDANCVQCHTDERAKALASGIDPKKIKIPNLSRDIVPDDHNIGKWYASYKDLKPYVFYSYGERHRTMPGNFGARASKLYPLLKNGHYDVKLSEEELQKIALWLDCVSLFYGVYEKEGGEAQLRGEVAYPTLE